MDDVQRLLLKAVGAALFGRKTPRIGEVMPGDLLRESQAQAVYPLVFSVLDEQLEERMIAEQYAACSNLFLAYSVAGTRNFDEHSELHELMTAHEIPYVVMKGISSARYYPDPSLRTAGDVDFLVNGDDLHQAGKLLEGIGFAVDHGNEDDEVHITYMRQPTSVWELHRSFNGIPGGETGEKICREIGKAISRAETAEICGAVCRVPDRFRHGLILLLHTASHLTSEGVGLRHLCDWVVFASSMSDAEFREIFEKRLRAYGLWHFAQVLTLIGIRYLGAPKRVWPMETLESKKVSDDVIDGLMDDILSGGNFGTKDGNRYREIKYISDRGERTVSSGGILRQGFRTLNNKVFADHKTIEKHRILLPFGYLAEGGKYLGLLLTGKRKNTGTTKMLKEAAERKKIYASLHLFES